jgi:hypothetical protein
MKQMGFYYRGVGRGYDQPETNGTLHPNGHKAVLSD